MYSVALKDERKRTDISSVLLPKDDGQEAKELIGLTIQKLLTKIPVLLTEIKPRNNSYKLKNEIRHIPCFASTEQNLKKKLQQFNQVIIRRE